MKRKSLGIAVILLVAALALSTGHAFAETETLTLKTAKKYKTFPAEVIKKIALPKGYREGLFFDGKNIWVANGKRGKTWIIDPSSGSIISTIDPVGTFTEGITAFGDGALCVTDWDTKKAYRVRIKNNIMEEESAISLETSHPTGVAWTGSRLIIVTWTRDFITSFHFLVMDERWVLQSKIRIEKILEPDHLAWDGTHLWISSWHSRMVYKIDINRWEILGAFHTPVSKTTGIAWDGKYFWVTGTHGDLYQMKVTSQ